MTTTAHDHITRLLLDNGYTLQTTVSPHRGARLVWITGPAGVAGFHGTFTVGARSGRVSGGQLFPLGEDGPVVAARCSSDVYAAVCDALDGVRFRMSSAESAREREAALRGDYVRTLAEIDAAYVVAV